jgi:Restriction endonuclease
LAGEGQSEPELDQLRTGQLRQLEAVLLEAPGRVACLSGAPGSGKTTLAVRFAEVNSGRFPGGTTLLIGPRAGEERAILDRLPAGSRALLILDEADRSPVEALGPLLRRLRSERPLTSVLMTSSIHLGVGPETRSVVMPPLEPGQIVSLLSQQAAPTPQQVKRLASLLSGNASAASAASARLAAGVPAARVIEWLESGHLPTAVDPAGRELPADSPDRARLDVAVDEVSEELIAKLAANPELLYRLDPRKFEALVAELYRRQGFEATLTPASGDEGVDIYVVSRNDLGRTLWVVQAKRYAAENPIEAGVVRELYGTVMAQEASAGILVTTSFFQPGAERLERRLQYRLSLKDYLDLQEMLRKPPGPSFNAR